MGTCFTQKINTITSSTTSDSGPKKKPPKNLALVNMYINYKK